MESRNFEKQREALVASFKQKRRNSSGPKNQELKLSWSNWGFGAETLENTARRLNKHGIRRIELHGNRYGADLGCRAKVAAIDHPGVQHINGDVYHMQSEESNVARALPMPARC